MLLQLKLERNCVSGLGSIMLAVNPTATVTMFKTLITRLLLLFIFIPVAASAKPATPALYLAQKGDLKLYIMGSIHAGKGDYYPLPDYISQALNQSDVLYLEIAPEQMTPQLIGQALQKHGQMTPPTPLSQRMSKPTYQQLSSYIEHFQLPNQQMMFMRDWYIVLQLTLAQIQEIGMLPQFGVDQYMTTQAQQIGKTIQGLETADQQFSAIALMDKMGSEAIYQNLLQEMDRAKAWLQQVEAAWKEGNDRRLETLYLEYDDRQQAADLMQALLDHRNENWQQILASLSADKRYFVVVGDMHVHGQHNIRQLLQQSGFTISRVRSEI